MPRGSWEKPKAQDAGQASAEWKEFKRLEELKDPASRQPRRKSWAPRQEPVKMLTTTSSSSRGPSQVLVPVEDHSRSPYVVQGTKTVAATPQTRYKDQGTQTGSKPPTTYSNRLHGNGKRRINTYPPTSASRPVVPRSHSSPTWSSSYPSSSSLLSSSSQPRAPTSVVEPRVSPTGTGRPHSGGQNKPPARPIGRNPHSVDVIQSRCTSPPFVYGGNSSALLHADRASGPVLSLIHI